MSEIRRINSGTSVVFEIIFNVVGEDMFDRFYVCFEKFRTLWSGSCRFIIGFDGIFLK